MNNNERKLYEMYVELKEQVQTLQQQFRMEIAAIREEASLSPGLRYENKGSNKFTLEYSADFDSKIAAHCADVSSAADIPQFYEVVDRRGKSIFEYTDKPGPDAFPVTISKKGIDASKLDERKLATVRPMNEFTNDVGRSLKRDASSAADDLESLRRVVDKMQLSLRHYAIKSTKLALYSPDLDPEDRRSRLNALDDVEGQFHNDLAVRQDSKGGNPNGLYGPGTSSAQAAILSQGLATPLGSSAMMIGRSAEGTTNV